MRQVKRPVNGTLDVVHVALRAAIQPRNIVITIQRVASALLSLQILRQGASLVLLSSNDFAAVSLLAVKGAFARHFEALRDLLSFVDINNIIWENFARTVIIRRIALVWTCQLSVSLHDFINLSTYGLVLGALVLLLVFSAQE